MIMRHIALVLTQSLESPSGLGRYWPVARELVRLGYRVSIIAPHHNFNSSIPLYEVRDGVEIWISGQMHVRKVGPRKEYFSPVRLIQVSLRTAYNTARLIRKIKPDAIHLGKPQPINGAAARWVRAFNRQLTLYVDCDDYEAESNRTSGKWQRRILTYFEDSLPRLAQAVSVNTRFLAARVESLGVVSKRIHWIPNGVDRERFQGPRQIDRAAEWPGEVTSSSQRVLYVGSLSLINHPVDLLLDAFVGVHRVEPSVSLLIVGGGDDFDRLQAYTQDKELEQCVRFAGFVNPIEIPDYYRAAQVTVDPVYNDRTAQSRSPLKVVESLAAGVPVVTADVGDRRWVLEPDRAGVLVRAGDSTALAQGILSVIQNTAWADRLMAGARTTRERFWWDVLIKDWAKIYQE